MKKLTSIDLFAGIGGIRLGFDRAFGDNIETVFVSEWDERAQQTYRANFPSSVEISGDITLIDEKAIPSFDICLAGFPCQAFSLAGARKGFTDDYKGMSRGTLFFDVVRICSFHKPKVIFCENVKGLTIHDKGRTFDIIKGTLSEIGYTVHESVLNSKDYGVPQNRERIYIVAFRNDIDSSEFIFPEPTDSSKRIKDIIEENPVSAKYYLSDVYVETLRRHKARHESKGNGFGYEIRDREDIAGAIVCGGMGRERNLLIDTRQKDLTPVTKIKGSINTEGIRKMTPREWARLQGYPDSYELPVADVHLYKQFGNSVSVPVIEAIATNIRKILDNDMKARDKHNMVMIERKNYNIGEWSEIYTLLSLLLDGRLNAANESLELIYLDGNIVYFPVKNIYRDEQIKKNNKVRRLEFIPTTDEGGSVCAFLDNKLVYNESDKELQEISKTLLRAMTEKDKSLKAELYGRIYPFLETLHISKIKQGSDKKADIVIKIHDFHTGLEPIVGFSVKSFVGSNPTLVNASNATHFVYKVPGISASEVSLINNIESPTTRYSKIFAKFKPEFMEIESSVFHNNLVMIDSMMPYILSEMLLSYYSKKGSACSDVVEHVKSNIFSENNLPDLFIEYKFKEFLCAYALGMKAAKVWNGQDEADGGYIIVKCDGNIVAYHLYNRDMLKDYLYKNTKFDKPDERIKYGKLYEKDNEFYIKLSLQIRFR